jgi:hypothetical protein
VDNGGRHWRIEEEEVDLVQGRILYIVCERAGGEVALVSSADPVVDRQVHLPST